LICEKEYEAVMTVADSPHAQNDAAEIKRRLLLYGEACEKRGYTRGMGDKHAIRAKLHAIVGKINAALRETDK
jgi:hypothetical protein